MKKSIFSFLHKRIISFSSFSFSGIKKYSQFPPVLKGVRVLDLTHVVSGPYATLYLAMMGAEIIKIERPASKGDSMRATGPFVGNYSARFATLNHNKSSIVLDLSTAEGKDIFLKLVEKSDIVVDNFRPGVLDRLGIGYDKMSAANPKIVVASATNCATSPVPFAKASNSNTPTGPFHTMDFALKIASL